METSQKPKVGMRTLVHGGPFSRGMDGNNPKIDMLQAELHEAVQSSRMILVLQSSPCKPPPTGVGALGCLRGAGPAPAAASPEVSCGADGG